MCSRSTFLEYSQFFRRKSGPQRPAVQANHDLWKRKDRRLVQAPHARKMDVHLTVELRQIG